MMFVHVAWLKIEINIDWPTVMFKNVMIFSNCALAHASITSVIHITKNNTLIHIFTAPFFFKKTVYTFIVSVL